MAIIMIQDLVSDTWELRQGDVIELDPIREVNWVSAGYADWWDEDGGGDNLFDEPPERSDPVR